MRRPSFQFYPGDWRNDIELRACSMAARGLWIELMCIAHECEPYGHLRANNEPMTIKQISKIVGMSPQATSKLIAELLNSGVARKLGDGTIYSRRMVKDEEIRKARANGGLAGAEHGIKGAEHGIKGGRPPKDGGLEGALKTPLSGTENPPPFIFIFIFFFISIC